MESMRYAAERFREFVAQQEDLAPKSLAGEFPAPLPLSHATEAIEDIVTASAVTTTPDASSLPFLSLVELAELIRQRVISPVEVCESQLERIAMLDPVLGAFITVVGERALEQARNLEDELMRGNHRGLLHGVPISLKDSFSTAGVRTTRGSGIYRDHVPGHDSAAWQRLEAAGAVLLGKNNLSEFGYTTALVNQEFGASRNPWDTDRATSGSSTGSAAAVAAGMSYLSVGAECGASVQRPASFCGVVGFKPTYGRISLAGSSPTSLTMDHVALLTRTVRDAAVGYESLAFSGPSVQGMHSLLTSMSSARPLEGLRLGVLRRHVDDRVDGQVADAFWSALEHCRSLGATVVELDSPSVDYAGAVSVLIRSVEASTHQAQTLRDNPDGYSPILRTLLERGLTVPAEDYVCAQLVRDTIAQEVSTLFEAVDLLVAPTAARTAPRIAEGIEALDDHPWDIGANHYNLLRLFTLIGVPAITVPCGFDRDSLPIGLQFAARRWSEDTVLRVAAVYEATTEWHTLRPAL